MLVAVKIAANAVIPVVHPFEDMAGLVRRIDLMHGIQSDTK